MYLHLGEETVVRKKDIIGIFDIENTSISKHTKDFLARSEKGGRVVTVSYEMPKSFVVCKENGGEEKVYISQISASTLKKRAAE
ncbi:MAG: DUF370 domain-containing protein [Oscillospiraceae bacterium]|nr:DUF370 domain-containing protein [Oscillospiraceae bacterium]